MENSPSLSRLLATTVRPHLEGLWRRLAPRLRRALGLGRTEAQVDELESSVRRLEAQVAALENDRRALAALIPTFFEEARAAGQRR